MGVERIVLGREVTIKEAGEIKRATGLEIEMFVHGSMCMAFSGNCVISNYTQGRDSNRGGCAHSCRFEYSIDFQNNSETKKAYFMSSKDLEGIRLLEEFIKEGIDSLKVEGRNKSHHYAGTISKVYSMALKYYREHGNFLSDDILKWEKELRKISHRDYTTASLIDYADETSIYNQREQDDNDYVICGVVVEAIENHHLLIDVKSAFFKEDVLEAMVFSGDNILFNSKNITTISGTVIEKTKPGSIVKIPYIKGIEKLNLIRKEL